MPVEPTEPKLTCRLVGDSPAQEDLFKSKSHQRTAKALSKTIQQLSDNDGAIGLEGGWGAGKSSVINFSEKILKEDTESKTKYHIFQFDLWAHGGDDIRRAVLEEAIAWAQKLKLLTTKKAKEFRARVADKTEVTKYETKKQYGWYGWIIVFLFAPIFPFIVTWLSPFAFSSALQGPASVFWMAAASGIALFYLVAIIQMATKRSFSAIGSLNEQTFENHTETKSIRRRDPTTIEFQSIFRDILSEIQKKNDRIVVVLDNIDRLPSARIPSLWAEVRSIFSARKAGDSDTSGRRAITAVVPYDLQYISKAIADRADPHSGHDGADARSIVRKTFSSVIRVSPPISTDWREFFEVKLREAFTPNFDKELEFTLYRILKTHHRIIEAHPTPRDIIAFINNLVILKEQWGDSFPAEALSLFALYGDKLIAKPHKLVTEEIVDKRMISTSGLGPSWKQYLAALLHNVEMKDAAQVTLGPRIANYLEGEAEKPEAFPGFDSVLINVIEENAFLWSRERKLVGYSKVAAQLQALELDQIIAGKCWAVLAEHLHNCELESIDDDYPDDRGIFAIIANQSLSNVSDAAEKLTNIVNRYIDGAGEIDEVHGEWWAHWIEEIYLSVKLVSELEAKALMKRVSVPKNGKLRLGIISTIEDAEYGIEYNELADRRPESDTINAFIELVGSQPNRLASVICARPDFLNAINASELAKAVVQKFQAAGLEPKARQGYSSLLAAMAEYEPWRSKIRKDKALDGFRAGGAWMWHLSEAINQKENKTIANLIFVLGEYAGEVALPNVAEVPNYGGTGNRHQNFEAYLREPLQDAVVVELVSRIESAGEFARWLGIASKHPESAALVSSLESAIDAGTIGRLKSDYIPVHYDSLKSVFSASHLRKLVELHGNSIANFDGAFEGEASVSISREFLKDVGLWGFRTFDELPEKIDSYFNSLEAVDWRAIFEGDEQKFRLLVLRCDKGFKPPAQKFREAFVPYITAVATGVSGVAFEEAAWSTILGAFSESTIKKLGADTYQTLANEHVTTEGATNFVRNFRRIADNVGNTRKPADPIDAVLVPLLGGDGISALEFVSRNQSELRKIVKRVKGDAKSRLETSLEELAARDVDAALKGDIFKGLGLPEPMAEGPEVDEDADE